MAGKYNYLCDEICEMIETGKLKPGHRAPSENELIGLYGLSYTTIKTAYNKLADRGVIVRRRGSGTYVTDNAFEILEDDRQSSGKAPDKTCRAVHILLKEQSNHDLSLLDEVNVFVTTEILKGINDALIKLRIPYYQHYVDEDKMDFSNINPQDGIIMLHGRGPENLRTLKREGIPFVVVNYPSGFVCKAGIEADDASGIYDAVGYLADQGCKRVAYLGPVDEGRFMPRHLGFIQGVREYQMVSDEIPCNAVDKEGINNALNKYLNDCSLPEAIIAATDHRALICMKILQEKGLKIPEDIAIIGFDDSPEAVNAVPALTTVRKPRYEMGYEATLMLLDLFRKPDSEVIKKVLKTSLVVRESAVINISEHTK